MTKIIIGMVIAFVLCVIISPFVIPLLRKLKFGQEILEIGPNWHSSKKGTPTMGGITFILSTFIAMLIVGFSKESWLAFGFAFACGIIGFVDDFIKVYFKRNMGFNALQKTMCLILAIVLFIGLSVYLNVIDTKIFIPFMESEFDLGIFFYPLVFIAIFATVNSVNLTDGIDGLAGSVTSVVMLFFVVVTYITQKAGLALMPACLLGALVGFLVFNLYPAKMFMGDTGSLFLGGMVCALAVLIKNPLILLIVGFVYVMEALSDIIQVTSFKLTGKRVFKMAPLHHHFEMCGFSENKIVVMFTSITILLCALGYFAI